MMIIRGEGRYIVDRVEINIIRREEYLRIDEKLKRYLWWRSIIGREVFRNGKWIIEKEGVRVVDYGGWRLRLFWIYLKGIG